ncbi:MAG: PAS domain S-box protein [Chlorobiaceae bacterium]|nr:PAS domain S-box protein [Chlorobiaceae bacterium]
MTKKQQNINTANPSELRSLAEKRLMKKHLATQHSHISSTPSPEETLRLVHELEIHQIELEIQQEILAQSRYEIENSLAKFNLALEAASAGVWEWELKTNELFWSDNLWNLSGLKRRGEKPTFKLWENTIHPDDRELVIQSVTAAVKDKTELNFEYRLCYPDGSVHWNMSRGRPLHNDKEEVDRYIGTVIDITERKLADEALKKYKERFKTLFDKHTSSMLVIDPVTRNIVDANHAAAEFYGWTIEDLQLMQAEQLSVSTVDNLLDDIKKIRTTELNRIIRKHKRADGLIRDVEITINSIVIEGKEFIYAVINDISDRMIAEKLILESNERFRSLFDNMLNGIAYCRMIFEEGRPVDFIYEQVNSSFELQTGLKHPEGKKVSEVIPGVHDLNPELLEIYARVAISGQPERFEFYLEALNMWLEISAYSMQKDHFVAVFDNITKRKKTEQLIVEGKLLLEAALASMSDAVFISDNTGNFIHFNEAFATFHRFRNKEECARTFDEYPKFLEVYMITGEAVPVEQWAVPRALRDETGTGVEFRLLRKDSGETWFGSYNYAPLRNKEGIIVGSIVTARDISERKAAEEKMKGYVKQLENAMQSTLQAVANVVEAHDPYTAGHERRVGVIAADLAREMGWSEEKCHTLQLIGFVHDIGKMSIPAEILSKPGRLSAIEFELVKTHAEQGYQILKNVDFPMPIARIIREHHERMDGSGYPQCLKGEETLPESRILAVADVLEAMASHRPYRPSLGLQAALEEIERYRVQHFDPEVVDAMLRLFREKGYQLPL